MVQQWLPHLTDGLQFTFDQFRWTQCEGGEEGRKDTCAGVAKYGQIVGLTDLENRRYKRLTATIRGKEHRVLGNTCHNSRQGSGIQTTNISVILYGVTETGKHALVDFGEYLQFNFDGVERLGHTGLHNASYKHTTEQNRIEQN